MWLVAPALHSAARERGVVWDISLGSIALGEEDTRKMHEYLAIRIIAEGANMLCGRKESKAGAGLAHWVKHLQFSWVAREGRAEEVTLEEGDGWVVQMPEEQSCSQREQLCKGPVVRRPLLSSRKGEKAGVAEVKKRGGAGEDGA